MNQDDMRFEAIKDDYFPVSIEQISRIEARVGSLPSYYVEFISTFGGCGFSGEAVINHPDGEKFPIFTFFGRSEDSQDICEVLDSYPDLESDKKLPIADDMMGNIFVLDPHNGHVFLIDYAQKSAVAYRLANSFSEFLEILEVTPFDE